MEANSSNPVISRRLWLAFGIVTSILLLTLLIYGWQLQRVNTRVNRIVEVYVSLEQAVTEMQFNAISIAWAISAYTVERDPSLIADVRRAESGFEIAMVRFEEIGKNENGKILSPELSSLYKEFNKSSQDVITSVDQQQVAVLYFRKDAEGVEVLINGMAQATIDGSSTDSSDKLRVLLDMQDCLRRVSAASESHSLSSDNSLQQEIMEAREQFKQSLARYRETALSAYESNWLNYIDTKFTGIVTEGIGILSLTDNLHTSLSTSESLFQRLDTYLAQEVRPPIHNEIGTASEDIKTSITSSGRWLITLAIAALLIGIVSTLVISRKITRPIRNLVEGAKLVSSGRIDHRFDSSVRGEFGQLALSLNHMLDNLDRSRKALWESEELAWLLLDATNDAVTLTDVRGTVLASNERTAARFGMSLEQIVDESLYNLLPAESAASLKAHVNEVIRTKKPVHYEDEHEGKIIDQNIFPVLEPKGEISRIAIFSRDVTMRKWVEDVTEQLGRRNALILEAAGEGIYGLDAQGRTTFVNPAASRILGYKSEELIGKRHHELVHHSKPDGTLYPHEQCPIHAAIRDGVVHINTADEVFWRKDGTSFFVEYTSTPIVEGNKILGAVVTFRDISDRRRVEKALRESEQKYRLIFDSAASLIFSVDQQGFIIDCNARIYQMLGYTQTEVIGRQLVDFFEPDEQEKIKELLSEVVTKGFEYDNQYMMVHKDRSSIKIRMNIAVARDTSGEYIRTICMINRIND